jgi:toluene monooxygenase system protein A
VRTLLENGATERAQYLVDKMWWRCWRLLIALTGTAMEYLTPLDARVRSFKEFMEEWVVDQFMKNLAEFDLERPWFWDLFVEELDFAHHSFQLGLYSYRTTLWFDTAMPDERERAWLRGKYPSWDETFGPIWDRLERAWETDGEAGTLAYTLPALCNLCQLPTLFVRPGKNTACTLEADGRRYVFCSEPCRWIFTQEKARFAAHHSVIDRIVAGEAPGKLTDLHAWMGLDAPVETGKDLRRGLNPWRLAPVPTA